MLTIATFTVNNTTKTIPSSLPPLPALPNCKPYVQEVKMPMLYPVKLDIIYPVVFAPNDSTKNQTSIACPIPAAQTTDVRTKLARFCYKQYNTIPHYDNIEDNGFWTSRVTVGNIISSTGKLRIGKDRAECNAAQYVLRKLYASLGLTGKGKKRVILVDVENINPFKEYNREPRAHTTVYAFKALSSKGYIPSFVKQVVCPMDGKDSADITMQAFVGALLMKEEFDEYVIVTRDHFGPVLASLIESETFGWKPRKARVITTAGTYGTFMI